MSVQVKLSREHSEQGIDDDLLQELGDVQAHFNMAHLFFA